MLTFSGNKRLRNALVMYPDLLKSLSEGTLVPHIHKYFFAKAASTGKRFASCFHHSKGSESISSTTGKSKYLVISASTLSRGRSGARL